MLSVFLHIIENYRLQLLKYLGLPFPNVVLEESQELKVWLRSVKLLAWGEGLADKGFENCESYFSNFNRVRCPRIVRSRDFKQCDVIELMTKGKHFELRCTSEVAFYFFRKCRCSERLCYKIKHVHHALCFRMGE